MNSSIGGILFSRNPPGREPCGTTENDHVFSERTGWSMALARPGWLKLFLPLMVTVLAAALVLRHSSRQSPLAIYPLLADVSIRFLLVASMIYLLLTWLRSWRIKLLLNDQLGLRRIMPIVLSYNLLNFIVPLRLGELSYISLVRRTGKISTPQAVASLTYFRFLDVLFLCVLIAFGILLFGEQMEGVVRLREAIAIFAAFLVAVLLCCFSLTAIRSALLRTSRHARPGKRILHRLLPSLIQVVETLISYNSARLVMAASLLTLAIWVLVFTFLYTLALSLGIEISFYHFSLSVLLINIFTLFPIQGLAGFGNFEGAVILGLGAYGFSLDQSLPVGIALHLLYIIFFVVFGLVGFGFSLARFKGGAGGETSPQEGITL